VKKESPSPVNKSHTVRCETGCPLVLSSRASLVVLLLVQRCGDSGSPRVTGSTSLLSAPSKPGSLSVNFLRPPPLTPNPVRFVGCGRVLQFRNPGMNRRPTQFRGARHLAHAAITQRESFVRCPQSQTGFIQMRPNPFNFSASATSDAEACWQTIVPLIRQFSPDITEARLTEITSAARGYQESQQVVRRPPDSAPSRCFLGKLLDDSCEFLNTYKDIVYRKNNPPDK
jgi:hypothetical protein